MAFGKRVIISIVTLSALMCSDKAFAIVNIETLRQNTEPGLSGESSFSVDYSSGNTDELSIKTATGLRNLSPNLTVLFVGSAELEERNDRRFDRKAFAHLRAHLWRQRLISPEVFVQTQYDETRRIDSRSLFGAGARLRLHSSENSGAYLGAGLMYEHENERQVGSTNTISDIARLSSYLSIFQQLGSVRFNSVSYMQPNVDHTSDFRTINESSLVVPIGKNLDFSVDFTLAYDSRPPESIEKTDSSTSFGLKIRW